MTNFAIIPDMDAILQIYTKLAIFYFGCHYSNIVNWDLRFGRETLDDISHRILGGRHFKLVNGLALIPNGPIDKKKSLIFCT